MRTYFKHRAGVVPVVVILIVLAASVMIVIGSNQVERVFGFSSKISCPSESPQLPATKPDVAKIKNKSGELSKIRQEVISTNSQYLNKRSKQSKDQLETNLKNRKKQMVEAMRADPTAALSKTVADTKQNSELSKTSENCVETPATVEGTLEVYHADFFNDKVGVTSYTLVTTDGQKLNIHPANDVKGILETRTKVKVKGLKLDNDLIFDASRKASESGDLKGGIDIISQPGNPPVTGQQNIAVIMVNTDKNLETTVDQEKKFFNDEIIPFYRENSYDKITLSANVFGPYSYPYKVDCVTINPFFMRAAMSLADKDIDYTQYSRIIIISHSEASCPGGLASIGKLEQTTQDGTVLVSLSWIKGDNATYLNILGHELGHNFGNGHANSLNCGSVSIAVNGCTSVEYGDGYDIMGGGNHWQFNAPHRENVGWLDSNNLKTVTTDGQFVIEPIETKSSGLKAIKIPRGDPYEVCGLGVCHTESDFLYVEYRQPIGSDKENYYLERYKALIHTSSSSWTNIVSAAQDRLVTKFVFQPGESLFDPVSKAKITIVSANPQFLTVSVSFGSSGGNSSPIPSATPTPTVAPSPTPTASPNLDSDRDGFNDALERNIGTDPNLACGVNAWPPDFNNDGLIRTSDISAVVRKVGSSDKRYDLNGDGSVTQADIDIVVRYYGHDCQ